MPNARRTRMTYCAHCALEFEALIRTDNPRRWCTEECRIAARKLRRETKAEDEDQGLLPRDSINAPTVWDGEQVYSTVTETVHLHETRCLLCARVWWSGYLSYRVAQKIADAGGRFPPCQVCGGFVRLEVVTVGALGSPSAARRPSVAVDVGRAVDGRKTF